MIGAATHDERIVGACDRHVAHPGPRWGPSEKLPARGPLKLLLALVSLLSAASAVAQPSARGYVDMVYVPQVDKVLLFGGQLLAAPPYTMVGETWWWDPRDNSWSQVTSEPQPSPRSASHLDVHAPTGTVVMFGGGVPAGGGFQSYSETWLFDPIDEAWSLMEPVGGESPRALIGEMFAYHEASELFVLHGGLSLSPFAFHDATWHLDLEERRWTPVETTLSPPGRNYNAFGYDPRSERLVMSGGVYEGEHEIWSYDPRGLDWVLHESSDAAPEVPYARKAFDPDSGLLLRYGGLGEDADVVWSFDSESYLRSPVAVTGPTPGGISRHAMTAVPGLGLVSFGGLYEGAAAFNGDLWVLDVMAGEWLRP